MWGEGTVLAGRYQLRQRIGGGSMGDVWRALDTVLGREVAVKILLPALLDDAGFAARFHTEARVLAALSHPGIVSVFDYGEADDPRTAFLVMELIAGRPLSDLLDESAPLSEATTLTVVAQTLEALQAAHDQGIVHRDVKPANLMLRGGSVVVTDFGVARTADARRLTAADVVLGTAVYAAPEQARHTAVTAAADQYAVGVIAYECLTGAPPFDGGTPLGIMMKHLQEPVPPLPDTVSAPVRELVMRALAKDPAERFASAREMAETARRLGARGVSGVSGALGAAGVSGASGASGVVRIGSPQDSFQAGVDVAGVGAAAAGAGAGGGDADFLSFTVVPRGDADGGDAGEGEGGGAGDGGELSSAGGSGSAGRAGKTGAGKAGAGDDGVAAAGISGAAVGSAGEGAPAWASYAVRPQTEGTDWASFTVRSSGDATEPLPDGEAAIGGDAGGVAAAARGGSGRVVPQDSFMVVEADSTEEPGGAAPAGVGRWRSRTVPQDSFTPGVELDAVAESAAEPSRPARGGLAGRWRRRGVRQEAVAAGSIEESEKQAGEPADASVQPATNPATNAARESEQQTGSPAKASLQPGTNAACGGEDPGKTLAGSAAEASVQPGTSAARVGEEQVGDPADESVGRPARAVPEDSFTAGIPESVLPEPQIADPEEPTGAAADPVDSEPEPKAIPHIAPGHAMPLDSFNAGVELDPVDTPEGTGSARVVPQDSFTVLGADELDGPGDPDGSDDPDSDLAPQPVPSAQPGRRRAVVAAAVGAVIVVGIAVAYPLSHGKSSATAAVGATQATSSASSAVSTSGASVTSAASETPTIVVSSSAASGTSAKPSATAGSSPSTASVPPPPVSASSSAAVPHKSGSITNVGDSDAIDVFGTSGGAPIYSDGAQLTVEPPAGRTGQTFQATALTSSGQTVYEFGNGLDTNQLIAASGGKVTLSHGGGAPTQLWWLSTDANTPSGAFYINNQAAGQCLTDNGPSNALSLKPCVAGNKAQEWYLP